MTRVYVFGNEYLEGDGLALSMAKDLELDYVHCHNPDDMLESMENDENILILDVVKNISKPIIIDDVSTLKVHNIVSMHDFDVGFFLNMMSSIGMAKDIKIIGIPMHGDVEESKRIIREWLKA